MLLRVIRGSEHEQETLGVLGSNMESEQYTACTTNLGLGLLVQIFRLALELLAPLVHPCVGGLWRGVEE